MDFDTLLGKIETSRPDLSESISLIKQFQKEKTGNNNSVTDVDSEKVEELLNLLQKQKKITSNLFQRYQELEDNYKSLIEQLDQFADAIGACPQCWGEDVTCNFCRGRGKPGHFPPDAGLFQFYIEPAIMKLKTINS